MMYQRVNIPNYDSIPIEVEFLVIHYTGGTLERALSLFKNPKAAVSAHLIIGTEGEIIETVPCMEGAALRAWHAGKSYWFSDGRWWENFNNFSIGIELVNFNGNIFRYTESQYRSLSRVVRHLQGLYPALRSATRILGHEHIACWRGKADPGCLFEWERIFRTCYADVHTFERRCVCPSNLRRAFKGLVKFAPTGDFVKMSQFWSAFNRAMETAISMRYRKNGDDLSCRGAYLNETD